MTRRHLSPEEQALWNALARTVRPIRPHARSLDRQELPVAAIVPAAEPKSGIRAIVPVPGKVVPAPATVLDSSWERRIRGGTLVPDMSIDLHGHSLAAAHARLNQTLAIATSGDVRVLLVVTGKPPKSVDSRGSRRGAIRGEMGHWLETSPYADRIASVRLAHPRHGGDGALYIILRRKK